MLVFSRVLGESGSYLQEGQVIVAEGRLSVRDEKAPQLMCDRIRPLKDGMDSAGGGDEAGPGSRAPVGGKLYVKTPSAADPRMRKARLVLNMFPGNQQVVFYCADTQKRLGAAGQLHPALVAELREMFGTENVVLK